MAAKSSFGPFFYGVLLGGVVGTMACAIAAFYITNAPIPFVNKVDQASEKINPLANGQPIDPNQALNAPAEAPSTAPKSKVTTVEAPSAGDDQTPAQAQEESAKPQNTEISRYIVQAGAFRNEQAAEGRRAELGMLGLESRIIPNTSNGTTIYRVRIGPFSTMEEASRIKSRLLESSIQAEIGGIK